METKAAISPTTSNREFIARLRECVSAYFNAISDWEGQFKKFNRLSGAQYEVPSDLRDAQSAYLQARAAMEPMLPRARLLCRRFEINDPWPWLLKIQLGSEPQPKSALSPNERSLILTCMRELEFRIADMEREPQKEMRREQPAIENRGVLRRILDFFS